MAKLNALAKGTIAFIIIAVGLSIVLGTLMGGGYSRGPSANDDPRSVLIQSILIEADSVASAALPSPGAALSAAAFEQLRTESESLRSEHFVTRSPTMLVQHAEQGTITIQVGERTFAYTAAPRVIKVKDKSVLRLALTINQNDRDSGQTPRTFAFETAFTAAPGAATVLDLADLAPGGQRTLLAIRTSLVDPASTD